jgi:hypothetical protein
VTIFAALFTTAAVIGGILAVLERTYEPFLPFAHILTVRALEFELRFLDKSSVYALSVRGTTYLDKLTVVSGLLTVVTWPGVLVV